MSKAYLLLTVSLFTILSFTTKAQKLPEFQTTSLRAPAKINIDGKAAEWNKQFQAYNSAAGFFYTISNDNDKLYLVIQAEDINIANKIISAGLTFTINGTGKWKDEGGMAVTYPFLYLNDFPAMGPAIDYRDPYTILNKQLTEKAKDIKISGMKGIKDTLSVYNPEGIKTASLFDKELVYTLEVAIPLKYLELSVDQIKSLFYNLKLNGTPKFPTPDTPYNLYVNQGYAIRHLKSATKNLGFTGFKQGSSYTPLDITGPNVDIIKGLVNPTDFFGQYTLAK